MSGPYECQVRLYRDALSTPWGFRLQGGKDFKQPLSVQRVFVGSPADGELSRGDIILSINNYDASKLLHKQAQDIIKEAGGSVDLNIKRASPGRPVTSTVTPALPASNPTAPQGYRSRQLDKTPGQLSPQQKMGTNYSPSYGVSYAAAGGRQPAPSYMLNKIQENLTQAIYTGGGQQYQNDEEETQRSVGELKNVFADRQPPPAPYVQHMPHQAPAPHHNQPPHVQHHQQHQQHYPTSAGQYHTTPHPPPPPPPPTQPVPNPPPSQHYSPRQQVQNPTLYEQYQQYVDGEEEEEQKSVDELKSLFITKARQERPPARQRSRPRQQQPSKPSWVKPDPREVPPPAGLSEPGWSPYQGQHQHQAGWAPVKAPRHGPSHAPSHAPSYAPAHAPTHAPAYAPTHAPVHVPAPSHSAPVHQAPPQAPRPPPMAPQQVPHIEEGGRPAWTGTLKSSGGPKPWEQREQQQISGGGVMSPSGVVQPHQPRVQTTHFGPGGNIEYKQSPQGPDSDHARIQHLQYNTPIGLYSKDNVTDALEGQTSGRPGDGTMQVTGGSSNKPWDKDRSDVYRMIQEEENTKRKHRGAGPSDQSARYQEQAPGQEMNYHGYQDQSRQSRSMQALQAHFPGEEGMGTSDF